MGSYISSFKKFMKGEEKKSEKVGANPAIEEQADAATPTTDATATPETPTPAPAPASVESNPAVIAARTKVTNATAARDKALSDKQAELTKLKAAQDALVNAASLELNKALQDAAKAATPTT